MNEEAARQIAELAKNGLIKALAAAINPIHETVRVDNAASGENNLETKKVKPGRLHFIFLVTVEDKTTAYTKLRIGINDNENFHAYEGQASPSAATLYWMDELMILREGQRVRANLTGVTANDDLVMNVHGFWLEV